MLAYRLLQAQTKPEFQEVAEPHAGTPYQLIRLPNRIADRQFEIEFLDPGVAVFAFTFG